MSRFLFVILLTAVFCTACDENKVYQEYTDFEDRNWYVKDKPAFEFTIEDLQSSYNVYWNVRNSTQYPNSRIFVNFTLKDTTGNVVYNKLLSDVLFDPKSGAPSGKTGLGDLFDHRNEVLKNYRFTGRGPYRIELEQFMRTDTLSGVISVGVEIEKVQPAP